MKKTRFALFNSAIALLLCISMLAGTTYAWFTDQETSGNNIIQAGNLDAAMYWNKDLTGNWISIDDQNQIFDYDKWEPGYTEVRYVKIANEGNLAFKYALSILPLGAVGILADVIDVYYFENPTVAIGGRADLEGVAPVGTLAQAVAGVFDTDGKLGAGEDIIVGIALKMREEADNRYMGKSIGDSFSIRLVATQLANEDDSFDNTYDEGATFPDAPVNEGVTAPVENENGQAKSDVALNGENASATVPAGTKLEDGATSLTLTVTELNESNANITLGENEEKKSIDVHIDGIAPTNDKPIVISLGAIAPIGQNSGNFKLYHVENAQSIEMTRVASPSELTAHNTFYYDPATGEVTVAMATFSEVALVADTVNAWDGKFDYTWYDASKTELTIANADQLAAFGAIVGGMNGQTQDSFAGKTVKLVADINLGDKESENNPDLIFYPIGYYNSEGTYERTNTAITSGLRNFEGAFDGNGHTIENFYQNTWEMKGDHNWYSPEEQYYRDGMGLFGKVYGGTVKNLTVKNFSSDGEIATTGVIASYADGATFENIAIFNCNPRVYNIGNGGIVGCVGWYAKEANLKTTFKNITVDNSNKISALWGSYDVACGGIVGQYYPTSGQTSAGTPANGGLHFENCHVSAQMDVYNDVCGNYQYYAYRYAGMMIGSIRENTTNKDGKTIPDMTGISATGCTVNYGDWNDYYYCEFEKNGHPSYSGPDDYKFSRVPHSELNFTDSNGNGVVDAGERASVTGCKHNHTDAENNKAIYLPFHQLFTGYGWGVNSIGLEKYSGIVTNLDITEGDQEESVVKFEGKVTELANNVAIKLGDIFAFVDNGVELVPASLTVAVTNLDENNPVSATVVYDKNSWENGTITFTGTGRINITIQDYYFCTPTTITVTVTERQSEVKFETKFTGDFLYRVGNANAVALGTLFNGKNVTNENVTVEFETIAGNANGTYTANTSDWTKGTIQFSGTGVVKVTITDNDCCIPTILNLEVVDAKNIAKAESATANNVVLLNNISGTFTVSNGYTFYGNGFTVTLPTTSVQEVGQGFTGYISIGASQDDGAANGGHLDNVRIEGPVYPEMYIYRDQAKITDKNDSDYGSGSNMRYFKNSVIVYGGNVTISNCYISGSRTALCLRGGNNVVIENTTLSGGAYANMQICAGSSVTLRDLTTVQVDVTDSYGKGKTVHGLGIAVDSDVVDIYIEGELNQYNWLNQTKWNSIVPSTYQSVFPKFFTDNSFSAYWHYLNGGTDPYVNLAFIYACNWDTERIHDNRTTVDYDTTDATIANVNGGVYSKVNKVGGNAIAEANLVDPGYTSNGFNPIAPTLIFDNVANNDEDDANDANDTYCVYNESSGTLKIGVSGDSKTIDLSGVAVTKNGVTLTHTAYLNGTKISGNSVTIKSADGAKQALVFKATSNDAGYDKDGNRIAGSIEYTWTVTVEIAVLSYPAPVWNMDGDYQFDTTNCVYAYYGTNNGYGEAVPIYEGIKINYYDKTGKLVELDLSGTTTHPTGSNNSNSNAFTYTLSDGSTLSMKFSSGWKSGATTHQFTTYKNKVYIYPQSLDNDNYIRAAVANQDFDVKISYTFTDPNGQSITQTMQWYNAKANNSNVKTVQWKDFDSTNGKKPSCVTGDTLVTLADGTQKRIDSLNGDEFVLTWDFYAGEYKVAPIAILKNHGYDNVNEVALTFDDGTVINVLEGHGFFDVCENKFVVIDAYNVADYIGHEFIKYDGGSGYTTIILKEYSVESRYTEVWSILSAIYYDCMLNNIWTLSPADISNSPEYFMPFEIGEDLKFDEEKLQVDIENYGLYTYEEFADYCTYEEFIGFGFDIFKVSVGKGAITWDELMYMISIHLG